MFGYIKTHQPELKMGEFEQYRGLYCSLCRCLGDRYGAAAQMTLSYDMTFLLLLYLALSDDCAGFHKSHCPYNPFKKRMCCGDCVELDRCADASVLLVYYKARDTVADSRGIKRLAARVALWQAARHRRRAAVREPDMDRAMADYMAAQTAVEATKTASTDAAAEPTAQLLSYLCALAARDDAETRVLSRFGYCLGRWVYLMDAADDVAEDSRTGNYNPLLATSGTALSDARERVRFSLNASLAECKAAYELLNIRRFDGILRNILEYGMAAAQRRVLGGESPQEVQHEKSV